MFIFLQEPQLILFCVFIMRLLQFIYQPTTTLISDLWVSLSIITLFWPYNNKFIQQIGKFTIGFKNLNIRYLFLVLAEGDIQGLCTRLFTWCNLAVKYPMFQN